MNEQSLSIIEGQQLEIDALVRRGNVEPFEMGLAEYHTPQEKLKFIQESILGLQKIQLSASKAIMYLLWRVMKDQLWIIYNPQTGVRLYESYDDWVERELDIYATSRSDLSDLVRIVKRVFPFAISHTTLDEKNDPITPETLIWDIGPKKLKEHSSRFISGELTSKDCQQLLRDMTSMSSRDLQRKYASRRENPLAFPYFVSVNANGTHDIVVPGLSAEQVELIRTLLDGVGIERSAHLPAVVAEAVQEIVSTAV